jgi:hypothetical protein
MKLYLILIFSLLFLHLLLADNDTNHIYGIEADSSSTEDTNIADTPSLTGFSLPKNPTKAAFLSVFMPGAGQIYNEKYLKGAGVIATQLALIGAVIHYDQQTKKYKKATANSTEYLEQLINQSKYYDNHEKRQSYIFWVGASVFLSAIDAFVDAHLINFLEEKNKIHLRFEDDMVQLSIKF